jgi:hypothetical protein
LKTKTDIKEQTELFLDKRLKSCERTCKNSAIPLKVQNCEITGIEEGEEVQAKCVHIIVNKIVAENLPNLEKVISSRYRKLPGHKTDMNKIELLHGILSLKQLAQRTRKEF